MRETILLKLTCALVIAPINNHSVVSLENVHVLRMDDAWMISLDVW